MAISKYVLLTGKIPVSALKRKIDNARLVEPKDWNNQVSDRTNRAILTGMKLDSKLLTRLWMLNYSEQLQTR